MPFLIPKAHMKCQSKASTSEARRPTSQKLCKSPWVTWVSHSISVQWCGFDLSDNLQYYTWEDLEKQIFTLVFPSFLQVQYGIFPDNFTFNILLDCFIKQKKYEGKKICPREDAVPHHSLVVCSYICRAFL